MQCMGLLAYPITGHLDPTQGMSTTLWEFTRSTHSWPSFPWYPPSGWSQILILKNGDNQVVQQLRLKENQIPNHGLSCWWLCFGCSQDTPVHASSGCIQYGFHQEDVWQDREEKGFQTQPRKRQMVDQQGPFRNSQRHLYSSSQARTTCKIQACVQRQTYICPLRGLPPVCYLWQSSDGQTANL